TVPLAERARSLGAHMLDRTPIVAFTPLEGRLCGAVAVQLEDNDILDISTGAVVAACGGASHLFARTNGTVDATGDVIALAMGAGAVTRDMEFVQWHPTRMDDP